MKLKMKLFVIIRKCGLYLINIIILNIIMFEIENNLTTIIIVLILLFIFFYYFLMSQVDNFVDQKIKKNKKSLVKQIMYIYKKYNKKNNDLNENSNSQENFNYNNFNQQQENIHDTDEDSLDDVGINNNEY